jgi:hydroxymethylbilane synthase
VGLVVEGSCDIPLGAFARVEGDRLSLEAFVGLPDATRFAREKMEGPADAPEKLGEAVARRLLDAGGREILAQLAAPARGGRVA